MILNLDYRRTSLFPNELRDPQTVYVGINDSEHVLYLSGTPDSPGYSGSNAKTTMPASLSPVSCVYWANNSFARGHSVDRYVIENDIVMPTVYEFLICNPSDSSSDLQITNNRFVAIEGLEHMYLSNKITSLNWFFANYEPSRVTVAFERLEGLEYINTSNIKNFTKAFDDLQMFSDLGPLRYWDIGSATTMSYMFANCKSLSDVSPLADWKLPSTLTDMSHMFSGTAVKDATCLANWDVSHVTSHSGVFPSGCKLPDNMAGWA